MSIIDLQQRLSEVGRIRIGQQVTTGQGRSRPAKLDTFRLTSQDRQRIDDAAHLFGGTVTEWQAPSGGQWEVVTEATSIDVIVPPTGMAFSQYMELWSGGGCVRRCDGVTELISDSACVCDPDSRDCSPHTRLSVMIRDLAGLGVWRLDTSGWHAAVELGAAIQVLGAAAAGGVLLPARLRLEQRTQKRPGEPTRNFAVPVLDVDVTPAQLVAGVTARPLLNPVPATLELPVPSIAAQIAVAAEPLPARSRRGGQVPIPADPELDASLDANPGDPVAAVDDGTAPFVESSGPAVACPACGSEVWDNRARVESGELSGKHPKFKCSNSACEGVTVDGVAVTDGTVGEPWVTWHAHYFDDGDGAAVSTSDRVDMSPVDEIRAHIAVGAIPPGKVLTLARAACRAANVDQPSRIDEVWTLPLLILDLVADRVADWIADQVTT